MTTALLRARFARALRVSLVAAGAPAVAACGGAISSPEDGGTDAAKDVLVIPDSGSCRALDIPDVSPSSCGYEVHLGGDLSTCGLPTDGGQIPPSVCAALCGPKSGPPTQACYAWNGPGVIYCGNACVGRRPEGLRPTEPVDAVDVVGAYFAGVAHLEAASVDAFAILHEELVFHRAPRDLRQGALVAAADEIRHARTTSHLATSYGGRVEAPIVDRGPPRALEAIALENAVEGCVHETWGALLAQFQSEHARAPRVRAAMAVIAREEAEHALLGLRIAQWLEGKLDASARERVRAARLRAIDALLEELGREPNEELRIEVGLPTSRQALLLARSLFSELDQVAA